MSEQGSSFQWSDFRGGEWSKYAQGRIDDPKYRTALNVSENGQPVEEGAWTRRSGRRRLGASLYNSLGVIRTFWCPDHQPAVLEITYAPQFNESFLRFWVQQFPGMESDDLVLLCDNYSRIVNLSQDKPAILTVSQKPPQTMSGGGTWGDGDTVLIFIDPSVPLANGPAWYNRQYTLKRIDDTHFQLYDMETGEPADGSASGMFVSEYGNSWAGHVASFTLPYQSLDEVRRLRLVQTGLNAYLLGKLRKPILLSQKNPPPANAPTGQALWFNVSYANFTDGPYLDALTGGSQTGNSVAKLSQMNGSGIATFGVLDSSYFFQPGDIGRSIRVWCQPQPWQGGTYTGNPDHPYPRVTFQGNFWGLAATTNLQPGQIGTGCNPLSQGGWYLEQDFARWGYGTIVELIPANPYACRIQFQNPGGTNGGMDNGTIEGNSVTADGSTHADVIIDTWQLGAYTVNQYPTCGTFYQGRLWLGGALPNRIDACMSDGGSVSGFLTLPNAQNPAYYPSAATQSSANNAGLSFLLAGTQPTFGSSQVSGGPLGSTPIPGATLDDNQIYFSPTNAEGQVLDNHGIALVLNTPEQDEINFLKPHNDGMIIGSIAGEHVIGAAQNNGVLTPSSAEVRQISKYGAAFVEPLVIGSALVFVQSYGRRVIEFLSDFFSRRLIGRHLNEFTKHITHEGVVETAYQEENTPVLHCCMADGSLASVVYRRLSGFGTESPNFYAWSRYVLPDDRKILSITTAANHDGTLDQLVLFSTDGAVPPLNPVRPVPVPPLPPLPPEPPVNPTPPTTCCAGCGTFTGTPGGDDGKDCDCSDCGCDCSDCGCDCSDCGCDACSGCSCSGCDCSDSAGCDSGCDAAGCGCGAGCGAGCGDSDSGSDSGSDSAGC